MVAKANTQSTATGHVAGGALCLHVDSLAGLVTGGVIVLHRAPLPVPNGPHELLADFDGFLIRVRHEAAEEVPEVLRAGLVPHVVCRLDVDLLQPLSSVHQGPEVHVGVSMPGGPDHALRASGAGEPDVRVRLLHRNNPRVDHPVLVVLAFVAERAGLGPTLDDQVMRFLKPLPVFRRCDAAL